MSIILRDTYIIPEELIEEAYQYALQSAQYTSNRHDFHKGGLNNKQKKMFEGKLGEKIFKLFLIDNNILFKEDSTPYYMQDNYDFILHNSATIDVKTRTKPYHIRTLEMIEQFSRNPKDFYISVHLNTENCTGKIIGFATKEFISKNAFIENNNYLDNYVLYDNQLSHMRNFYNYCLTNNLIINS